MISLIVRFSQQFFDFHCGSFHFESKKFDLIDKKGMFCNQTFETSTLCLQSNIYAFEQKARTRASSLVYYK